MYFTNIGSEVAKYTNYILLKNLGFVSSFAFGPSYMH